MLLTICGHSQCWQTVDAGAFYCAGIKKDGTFWSWGNNSVDALGDVTLLDKNIPTRIGTGTNWITVRRSI